MHVLITGAAGMIGRKLTERLVADGALNGQPIDQLTLLDVVRAPQGPRIRRQGRDPSPATSLHRARPPAPSRAVPM